MAAKKARKTAKKAAGKGRGKPAAGKKVSTSKGARKTASKVSRKAAPKKAVKKSAPKVKPGIDLNSEQGIRDVAELHQRLLAVAGHDAEVTIDASSIARIDTAVLQVLTAFVIERKRQGRTVRWKGPSEVFAQAARIIDLSAHLDLPEDTIEV